MYPPSVSRSSGGGGGSSSFLGLPRPAPPRSEPGEGSRGAELVVVVPVCGALGAPRLAVVGVGRAVRIYPRARYRPPLPLPSSEGRPGNWGGGGLPGSHPSPVACACPAACGPLSSALPVSAVPATLDVQGVGTCTCSRGCVVLPGLAFPPLSSAAFPRLGNAGDRSFSLWGSLGALRVSRGIDHALGGRPLGNGGPVASGASLDDVGPVPLHRFPPPRSPAAGPQPRRAALWPCLPEPPLRGELSWPG